ncbi:MAG: hypothetical protein ACTHJL_12415 [Amnibacterium sp.]
MTVLGVVLASVGVAIVVVALVALALWAAYAIAEDRHRRAAAPRYCRGGQAAPTGGDPHRAVIPTR